MAVTNYTKFYLMLEYQYNGRSSPPEFEDEGLSSPLRQRYWNIWKEYNQEGLVGAAHANVLVGTVAILAGGIAALATGDLFHLALWGGMGSFNLLLGVPPTLWAENMRRNFFTKKLTEEQVEKLRAKEAEPGIQMDELKPTEFFPQEVAS